MVQVELSSFQSFYNASSKSPFKSFPWKSGSMHFRFLPVSPQGQSAATCSLTRCMDLMDTSHQLRRQPAAVLSFNPKLCGTHFTHRCIKMPSAGCTAARPGQTHGTLSLRQPPCRFAMPHHALRQLVAAGPYITLLPCRRIMPCGSLLQQALTPLCCPAPASCPAAAGRSSQYTTLLPCRRISPVAAYRSRPVHHSAVLPLHHALRQLVTAGQYTTLLPCRRALICNPRRQLGTITLLLYRGILL